MFIVCFNLPTKETTIYKNGFQMPYISFNRCKDDSKKLIVIKAFFTSYDTFFESYTINFIHLH